MSFAVILAWRMAVQLASVRPRCRRKALALKEYTTIVSRDLKSQDILRMNRKAMNTKQLYELYIYSEKKH